MKVNICVSKVDIRCGVLNLHSHHEVKVEDGIEPRYHVELMFPDISEE